MTVPLPLVAECAAGVIALLPISIAGAASSEAGDRDLRFGTGGLYRWSDSDTSEASATRVAVQPDGKLVTAGYADLGSHRVVRMIRLTPAGKPDPSFGFANESGFNDGLGSGLALGAHSDIAGGVLTGALGDGARATGVALQPYGRIVVVGSAKRVPGTTKRGFAVVRYQG